MPARAGAKDEVEHPPHPTASANDTSIVAGPKRTSLVDLPPIAPSVHLLGPADGARDPLVGTLAAERLSHRLAQLGVELTGPGTTPRSVTDLFVSIDGEPPDVGRPILFLEPPPDRQRFPAGGPSGTRFLTMADPNEPGTIQPLVDAVAAMPTASLVIGYASTNDHSSLDGWTSDRVLAVETNRLQGPFAAFVNTRGPAGAADVADAAAAGLPVVDTDTTRAISHGINGLVVDADRSGFLWAIRHLLANPRDQTRWGLAARRTMAGRSWRLLDGLVDDLAHSVARKRVCIVNTFAIDQPVNGGQRRLRQLAGALARVADVEILVLSQHAEHRTWRFIAPGLTQIEVPRSATQREAEDRIHDLLGFPTDDMTAAALAVTTPAWARELAERLPGADLVVSCHPYLSPTIPRIDGQPFVYDSYNAETAFKRAVLSDDVNGAWLVAETERVERDATERADLIVACTDADLHEIRELDPSRTHDGIVVSNGVDLAALPLATADEAQRARWELLDLASVDPYSDRPIVTFIGSSHVPNLSAAELLIAAARRRRDWIFILAGSHSSVFAESDTPLPDNVTLVPVFDEGLLWPLIAGADVAANPMLSGGGSNLKIFDYLAVGTPVLATPTGARGLSDPKAIVELVDPTVDAVVAGLDRLIDPAGAEERAQRSAAGRAMVEHQFGWPTLGRRWSEALGELIGGWTEDTRPPFEIADPVVLLDARPPSPDATIQTMQRIAAASAAGEPTSREIIVDPAFREHLRTASAHRKVGRELPEDARLALPKKVLIRAGHALSNEQLVYNEAALAAMDRLMEVINDLRRDQLALTERLDAAETALANQPVAPGPSPSDPVLSPELEEFYEAFEDVFRGSQEDIKQSSAHYLDHLADVPDGPAIDVGCGRGEWLALLAEAGRPAHGFDTNAVAVERCTSAGLDATHGDGILHLEAVEPGSVAVVTSFHVIEHLPFPELHRFSVAAHRALMPGGKLMLETPNCLNLRVGASSFWLDPTHRTPIHPELLEFLLGHVGFGTVDVFGINPEEGSTPTDLDPDPARNGLLSEFHRLIFGSLDLAAVATKH